MNKKILLVSIVSGLILGGFAGANYFNKASASDSVVFDMNSIVALSHNNGETVNFINSYIKDYWDSSSTDINHLKTLYETNSEMDSYVNNLYNQTYIRNLYKKWDDFKPVNNVLSWKSNIRANSYDIVVSLNDELTEAVYEEKGIKETNYTMVNPYANSHYFWQVTAHTDNGDVKSSIFDFYSGDYKRTVDISGISNTRDVGGFNTEYGYTKQGLIYRSGRIDDVDKNGVDTLNSLGIQTDLDLRSKGEGKENPASLPNYYLKTIKGYSTDFKEQYRPNFIEAVRVFTNPNNYPVMFHCAIGRDRTGTLGIVLQALMGASKEYIIHDYYTSMWSVCAPYQKTLTDLNLTGVKNLLNDITQNDKYSLKEGAEIFLKQREDTITHEQVGLTDEEIQAIRDIWTGKTPVEHAPKTFVASSNYQGKALVKFKAIGHLDRCMMVTKGTKVTSPYDLDNNYAWYSNGSVFDFDNEINEATLIYADYRIQNTVVIHFVGISKKDEIIYAKTNDVIELDDYVLDGYDMMAISDDGKEISRLKVIKDAYINIIYFKK